MLNTTSFKRSTTTWNKINDLKASKINHSNELHCTITSSYQIWHTIGRKLTISKLVEASWFSYSNEQVCEFCSPRESIWTWSLCPSCSSPNAYGWKLLSWLSDRDPLESQVQVLDSKPQTTVKKNDLNNIQFIYSTSGKRTIPWALRIRNILFPVTLLTWAIPWESHQFEKGLSPSSQICRYYLQHP